MMTPEQFNAVFRAHLSEVSRYLGRRVDPSDVEDIASELFEIAWAKRASIPEGFELAWLYKTAKYLIANHRRKTQNRARIFAQLSFPDSAPSAESIAVADLGLSNAWSKLSAADRELLSLWAFEGMDPKQIAVVIEISANAVAIRLTRAKERLRNFLDSENSETLTTAT
jgi:RNA polymerase sigma factor (sigma-70 family)